MIKARDKAPGWVAAILISAVGLTMAADVNAQGRGGAAGGPPPGPPPTPKAAAPIDLTGYWVALITEDWRYRMAVPPKGDFIGVPVNQAARDAGNAWDSAKDEAAGEQCKAYGVGGLMRMPMRLNKRLRLHRIEHSMQRIGRRFVKRQDHPSALAGPRACQDLIDQLCCDWRHVGLRRTESAARFRGRQC